MPRFVVLLRGVNVGKARRVPMADFRALLGDLGHTGIVTVLNSGNAVFDATSGTPPKHATAIAQAITRRLGIEVPVIVKSARELAGIVASCPFAVADDGHSRFLVAFVQTPAEVAALAAVQPLVSLRERFALGQHAAYLDCADGILQSKAGEALLGKAGRHATTRNWATVLKLAALAAAT